MSAVFIFGCMAPVPEGSGTQRVLDPCNCSNYYVSVTNPTPQRQLQICPEGELWHYKDATCRSLESVVDKGLCNRKLPWDRCLDSTRDADGDAFRVKIKNKCIDSGRYDPDVAQTIQDQPSFLLPQELQHANIGLMVASFVAGCVVTLILVAMILTICGLPSFSFPKKLQHMTQTRTVSSKSKKNVSKKSSKRGMAASEPYGDDSTVMYEDIDDKDEQQVTMGASSYSTTRTITTAKTNTRQNNQGPAAVSITVGVHPPCKPPPPLPKQGSAGPRFDTNLARKSPGPTLMSPPKTRNPDRPHPKAAMLPPGKRTNVEQQPSFGYIHPK